MAWTKKRTRNRRLRQDNVLNVKLRSKHAKAARMRMGVAAASLCFGVVFALYVFWRSGEWLLDRMVYSNPAFAIQRIDLQTDGEIRPDLLCRWAGVKTGINIMGLDLTRVKRNLELVSAIRFVSVERELPDILHIRVHEREPVAEIAYLVRTPTGVGTAKYQLDKEGYVMRPLDPRQLRHNTNSIPAGLPLITGYKSVDIVAGRQLNSDQIHAALRLIHKHEYSSMGVIAALKEIDVSHPQVLRVTTSTGSQITFGTDGLDRQLLRWHAIYELGRTNHLGIRTLDLSVTNNVPARWVQLPSASPSPAPEPPARSHRTARSSRRNV